MRFPELKSRLRAVADFLPSDARVVDVGCDHARLPIWLCCHNRARAVIAVECAAGPFDKARRGIARFGLQDRIDLRLCDGLSGVNPREIDVVVMAGMGGQTMMDIIAAAPWLADKTLVLQAQTQGHELYLFLRQNRFCVTNRTVVTEGGRQYEIWRVEGGNRVVTVSEIYEFLGGFAPWETAKEGDNVGFLAGRADAAVTTAMVALDITCAAIEEARQAGAQLIVSHHPLIYRSITSLTDQTPEGIRLQALLAAGLSALCLHTNLDIAPGGVNDCLASALGLMRPQSMSGGFVRHGKLTQTRSLREFTRQVCEALACGDLRVWDAGLPVLHVASGSGSCAGFISEVKAQGCDTFVTADCRHSDWLAARELGINLIDAGHYFTETVVCRPLAELLREKFPHMTVLVSQGQDQPFSTVSCR